MIPRVLHACWFGGKPIPENARQYIDSWKKYNPDYEIKIWNEDNTLKSEVNDKLLEIANVFMEFLEVPEDAIEDILIVGSSANYNYTKFSDIDVHLIIDYAHH